MQRFTISLDDDLAATFDTLIAERGYANRSEAVRDLIRDRLDHDRLSHVKSRWCVAVVSYVYDHHGLAAPRLRDLQHEHHDLVLSSLVTHLDHDNTMETVVLRGRTEAVRTVAGQLVALRGVRHGEMRLIPLEAEQASHSHGGEPHRHLRPLS